MYGENIDKLKKDAIEFINNYSGNIENSSRYISIIGFDTTGEVLLNWKDVSNISEKSEVIEVIENLNPKPNGAANLHSGLIKANILQTEDIIKDIESKNTIIFTHGKPTYNLIYCNNEACSHPYYMHETINGTRYAIVGFGYEGSEGVLKNTISMAEHSKKFSSIFTVCYGNKSDLTYKDNPMWPGPTVYEFLKKSVASANENAYDSENVIDLINKFRVLPEKEIDVNKLEVIDKFTQFIKVSNLPSNVDSNENLFNWKLSSSNPTIYEKDNKIIKNYNLEYFVEICIDENDFEENKYYPLNGDTYMFVDDQKIKFPIPAIKVENKKYTVKYIDGVNDEEVFEDQIYTELLKDTETPKFKGETKRKGYIFAGWSPELSEKVTENITYTAKWEEDKNEDGVADKNQRYTVKYIDGVKDEEAFEDQIYTDILKGTETPKFKGEIKRKGYIFVGWGPELSEKVTENVTYTAKWEEDKNEDGIADKNQRYTVKYIDGVKDEEVFEDQIYTDILKGTETPKFKGEIKRKGYIFVGWGPELSEKVTENVTYTAKWEEDKNEDGIADKNQRYTVKYTDGVNDEEVFKDQIYTDILKYTETPKFKGEIKRKGYVFVGWSPKLSEKVTKDVTYTAKWEEDFTNQPEDNPNYPINQDREGNRIYGADRIETAIEISKDLYPKGANAVVLANCERYTDVLTANPFAVQEKASVLFTYLNKLPEKTLREIERLGVKKIYISGGYSAVSKKIVDQLRNRGYEIYRFDGINRYDTARKIALKMREKGNTKVVELASGENYPDALSMTSMAIKDKAPILLTKKDSIPMYTKKALAEWDIETVKIAGLHKAISKEVEKQIDEGFSIAKGNKIDSNIYDGALSVLRYGGANRYETSTVIAAATHPKSSIVVYATGENFPDALVAGNYAGRKKAPVLLVNRDSLPSVIKEYNENSNIRKIVVIGGVNAISDYVFDLILND